MENKDNNMEGNKCDMCRGHDNMHHGMCGWCHMGKSRLIKWLIVLAVLFIVFSVGVKIGELKGLIRAEFGGYYGYPMMGSWYGNSDNNYYPGPSMMRNMMRWWGTYAPESTTTPR